MPLGQVDFQWPVAYGRKLEKRWIRSDLALRGPTQMHRFDRAKLGRDSPRSLEARVRARAFEDRAPFNGDAGESEHASGEGVARIRL